MCVLEAGVGHPFDDVLVGPDLGDVHGDAVGAAQAHGPDAVGVRGREELLDVGVVGVGDPAAVELEGLPVPVVVACLVGSTAWRGAVCSGHARRSNKPMCRSDATCGAGPDFLHIFSPRCPILRPWWVPFVVNPLAVFHIHLQPGCPIRVFGGCFSEHGNDLSRRSDRLVNRDDGRDLRRARRERGPGAQRPDPRRRDPGRRVRGRPATALPRSRRRRAAPAALRRRPGRLVPAARSSAGPDVEDRAGRAG